MAKFQAGMLTVCKPYSGMGKPSYHRLLEVSVVALEPTRWEWQVCEGTKLVMSGYETSRETAQVEGDSALFYLLRCPL